MKKSTLLKLASICFTIAAPIGASLATATVIEKIDEHGGYRDTKQIITCYWKRYIPTAIVCLLNIVTLMKLDKYHVARYSALMTAYTAFQTKPCIRGSRSLKCERNLKNMDGSITIYEPFSKQYKEISLPELIDAEYQLNRILVTESEVSMKTFLELLDIQPTKYSDMIGWSIGAGANFYSYEWIDVDHYLNETDDGFECYILDYRTIPTGDFREF